jgi:predicted RecA/RadA family phage recombinase
MQATFYHDGDILDYENTGSTTISDGNIVPLTTRCGVAVADIAAGDTGGVAVRGVFMCKAGSTDTFSAGDDLYYNPDDDIMTSESTRSTQTDAGTAEIASLTLSAGCTTAGNVTVSLDGTDTTVALTTSMSTAALAAAAIRSTSFDGWTTDGSDATVTFTATAVGTKTDATYSVGSTGASGTMTTTTQGAAAVTTTENNTPCGYGAQTKVSGTTIAYVHLD